MCPDMEDLNENDDFLTGYEVGYEEGREREETALDGYEVGFEAGVDDAVAFHNDPDLGED